MKPRTEELLYFILWTADSLLRPTWRNLNDGFEPWAWRNGFGRQIAELQQRKLLERAPIELRHAVVRLTQAGRLAALAGRDPDVQWNRNWDGHWRMVLFDIPVEQRALRMRLWRNLRRQGFGFLQNSVWITPDPIDRQQFAEANALPSVEMIIVIDGRPCAGESDHAIVAGAWDFQTINERYAECRSWFLERPTKAASFAELRQWAAEERERWKRAVQRDPFLPVPLLPPGYLGRKVWAQRRTVLAALGRPLMNGVG